MDKGLASLDNVTSLEIGKLKNSFSSYWVG